jgi:hypothetical protein
MAPFLTQLVSKCQGDLGLRRRKEQERTKRQERDRSPQNI